MSSNQPLQTVTTRRELLELIPKGSKIAEIGVFAGEFSREILEVCQPKELVLVDLWSGRSGSGDKDGNNFVRIDLTGFDKILARSLPGNVRVLKLNSLDYLTGLPKGDLDAIYIDACHTYDAVSKELALARTRVKKGGLILGHDYQCLDGQYDFSGVKKAVDEFCDREDLEISHLAMDNCVSFCIKNL